jgi:hypothetical protein
MTKRNFIEWCKDFWAGMSPTPRQPQKSIMKLAIYWEYWKDNRLITVQVMGPNSFDELDMIAKYGSGWTREIISELVIENGPGKLIVSVIRE